MDRASASGPVDSGLIPSRVKSMTTKLTFTASLFDTQHYREDVENKWADNFVPLRKALSGVFHLRAVRRWPVAPNRACYSFDRFLVIRG